MRPGQRLEAIQRIADSLAPRSDGDIDLVLETFGASTSDFGDWSTQGEYVVSMLVGTPDDALADLDAYLSGLGSSVDDDQIWTSGAFRLFISHTTAHRKRAASIAESAKRVGMHGFVAHDTIEPTTEWLKVIESALMSCDAMCAIVTPDFAESRWCDQEVGFALARGVPVLALSLGADPHGFMSRFQAIKAATGTLAAYADVHGIVRGLVQHPATSSKATPLAVRRYTRSGSWESTREAFEILKLISPQDWTPALIDEVDRANKENGQIAHANVINGLPIVDAVNEMLAPVRPKPVPTAASDDDIPF